MNKANVGASTNFIQMILDVCVGVCAFFIAYIIDGNTLFDDNFTRFGALFVVFMIVYMLTNKDGRTYNITTFYYVDRVIRNVTKSYITGAISVGLIVIFVSKEKKDIAFVTTFLVISYIALMAFTILFRYIHKVFAGKYAPRCLYVGTPDQFVKFNEYMKKTNINSVFLGYVTSGDTPCEGHVGYIKDLEHIIRTYNADVIYFIVKQEEDYVKKYMDICARMGVTVKIVVDFYRNESSKSYVSSIGTYPVITYHCISLNNTEKALKRMVDIVGSLVGIILSSPFMICAAIAIKLTSKGPVIFKQTRVGMNGRLFKIYKFRTMYQDAEERKKELMEKNEVDGFMFKMKDDPRITKVGKFLRKTSIDELPQFFNVLFGDMSLVGTRPPTVDEVSKYETSHWKRICIKPGITGMWQVSGRSSITSFEEIVALDSKYIDEWSVLMDIKVMLKTIKVLLKRDGAY